MGAVGATPLHSIVQYDHKNEECKVENNNEEEH